MNRLNSQDELEDDIQPHCSRYTDRQDYDAQTGNSAQSVGGAQTLSTRRRIESKKGKGKGKSKNERGKGKSKGKREWLGRGQGYFDYEHTAKSFFDASNKIGKARLSFEKKKESKEENKNPFKERGQMSHLLQKTTE